ncbi:MAG: hypothetical protein RBS86_04795, partial [Candidatus Moranbacteria bacterium]|nr:hypothetical protein [Candidatus Moranbacteria bacterium]
MQNNILSKIGVAINKVADAIKNLSIAFTGDTKNYVSSLYLSTSSQSIPNSTWTKIALDSKKYDPENCFDLTNNRFIAPVSGYYSFKCSAGFSTYTGRILLGLYKNGSLEKSL